MPKFAVGDHVERIGVLLPENMRHGILAIDQLHAAMLAEAADYFRR